MKDKKFLFLLVLLFIVLLSGFCGLYFVEHENLADALFFTLIMFIGNYADSVDNVLVNIARYGALLFVFVVVLSTFNKIVRYLKNRLFSFCRDSIFVLGNNELALQFIKDCNNYKVITHDKFMKANKYVLLGEDEENLKFIESNKDKLKDKEVFVKNETFSNIILSNSKFRFFSIEELAARKYWQNNPLKEQYEIAIIGFNNLSEKILKEAVVVNIFDENRLVNYYVFGACFSFEKTHSNLDKLNIKCFENYYEHLDILNRVDKIIIVEENNDVVKELLGCLNNVRIQFLTNRDISKELFITHEYGGDKENLFSIYKWDDGICTVKDIIEDESIVNAKKLNEFYHNKYGGKVWEELSSFERYSNIAAVDYYEFTTKRLLESWLKKNYQDITAEEIMSYHHALSRLEHIRWCNYHYYRNWTFNQKKNKALKQHPCLVSFDELQENEKIKDEMILELFKEVR